MAQTERSTATLQTLLADNVSGNISPNDIRDAIGSALGGYAGLSLTISGSPAAPLSVAQTPVKITEYDTVTAKSIDANLMGSTADAATGTITVGQTGIYHCGFYCSFSSSVNNKIVRFQHFVDNTLTEIEVQRFIRTGSDIGLVSLEGVFAFTAGEVHDVRVFIDVGTADLSFQALGFNIYRVG
jgi:hypothetical protein